MEKLLKFTPLMAFSAYLIKTILYSPTIPDAIIIFALVSYIVFEQMRLKDKQIREYDEKLAAFVKKHDEQTQEIKNVHAGLNSVKLGINMRSVQGSNRS